MTDSTISLIVFLGAYFLFVLLLNRRSLVAVAGAAVVLGTVTLSVPQAFS